MQTTIEMIRNKSKTGRASAEWLLSVDGLTEAAWFLSPGCRLQIAGEIIDPEDIAKLAPGCRKLGPDEVSEKDAARARWHATLIIHGIMSRYPEIAHAA